MKNKKTCIIIISISIVLTIAFIFSNSLMSPQMSNNESNKVVDVVKPMATANMDDDIVAKIDLSHLIRKIAHFLEFALLGFEIMLLVTVNKQKLFSWLTILSVSGIALIAFIDEFIQKFSGRTDSISDVILDIIGGASGCLFFIVLFYLIKLLITINVTIKENGNE
ncbi:MAG: VanZ family protein [Eubacteriales bacterium]|nr:VanZ family protein [Eubacteriales bacterium]